MGSGKLAYPVASDGVIKNEVAVELDRPERRMKAVDRPGDIVDEQLAAIAA